MMKLQDITTPLLETNILPYWLNKMTDEEHGGFYGRRDGTDRLIPGAEKGAVLNARILWTFSSAYRLLGKAEYLDAADRAGQYMLNHFVDADEGGVYWTLDSEGDPADDKKQTYAVAFALYGFSEYARATGDARAREVAIRLFHDIERHAFDGAHNGYVEALSRSWGPLADMRLSEKDENSPRTMNTHLHLLEAYTGLARVWPSDELKERLRNLLYLFTRHILNSHTHHLDLFFDECWHGARNIVSYGHDIEASWLLCEAAAVLGDDTLQAIKPIAKAIALASGEGLSADGSMLYERQPATGLTDSQRQWWVQCENVVGHVNLYQLTGNERALDTARRGLDYIVKHLVDHEHGEWYWSVDEAGNPDLKNDKAGLWKCPYHNSRMCYEMIERDV